MDVLLVSPPKNKKQKDNAKFEYLGCGYLLSSIKNKFEGAILDAYNYDLSLEDTIRRIMGISPKLVAISINIYFALPSAVLLIEGLRQNGYIGHISIGGHVAVSCKEKLIENLDINSICLGEGEECFPKLVEGIVNGNPITHIKGYWIRDNGQIIKNSTCDLIKDLDQLDFPVRENMLTANVLPQDFTQGCFTIITSRGCPFNCYFCDIKSFYKNCKGSSWRMRSAENLADEVEMLINKYKVAHFLFGDDNFVGGTTKGRERIREFCNEIKKRNLKITFTVEVRVSDIEPELFKKLKEIGLSNVMLGVESGSQRMLDTWNKQLRVEESKKALQILNDLEIPCHPNFILYDMYTSLSELEEVYDFIKETGIYKKENPIYLFNNKLGIYPETTLHIKLEKELVLKPYKFPVFTQEEQNIIDIYKPIMDYDIRDKQMRRFIENQEYWMTAIKKKVSLLRGNRRKYIIWFSRIGYLYLELFKKSIDLAKDNCDSTKELDELIDSYYELVCNKGQEG